MNGSASPAPPPGLVENVHQDEPAQGIEPTPSPGDTHVCAEPVNGVASPAPSPPAQTQCGSEPAAQVKAESSAVVSGGDGGESEAETLIDSPVKKREVEKQQQQPKPARSRIGGLPVPGEDDEDSESVATPVQSTEVSDAKGPSTGGAQNTAHEMELGSDGEDSSDSLSSAPSPASSSGSLLSGQPRAVSEGSEPTRNGAQSPNPRKRKHRASSAGLPNKRQSMEPPRRTLRVMHSEDVNVGRAGRSPSPKTRSHRRAISTQSAADGASDAIAGQRKSSTLHFPVRDPRAARPGLEESDASSETTSLGQVEARRPQRGIGRSTSTPGRPTGREGKRHINKYGFTRLAEACEDNELELVKEWRDKDPDQLEITEYAQNKPLQIAAVHGHASIVKYLIEQGCQIDCANVDKDTPLIDAAENGHLAVIKILLEAGVDPLRQNLKGDQALDVVKEDTEDTDAIRIALRAAIDSWTSDNAKQRREEEEEARHNTRPSKELHFMARTYENLLRLVTINDRNGVREFLDARVPVDNGIIAAAAKTGDQYLVNMLLAEMTEKKARQKSERPMLPVLGTSHFEMVKTLTELDQFNPLWTSKFGKTWAQLADDRNGPNWRQERELLQRLYDTANRVMARRSSSPVTKRDGGKRRLPPHQKQEDVEEGESSGEGESKPKNGRRLMSRRAMRAASGKAPDENSDSEGSSTSDTGGDERVSPDPEPVMRPPERRNSTAGTGHQRTKSMFSHSAADMSPSARRRSSSLRGPLEQPLPTVEEKSEDRDEVREHELAAERARNVLMQAQALDAKRRDAEEAEVEARRAEEQRRLEHERREEEDRQAAELVRLKTEEEEARIAEEQRAAEEERRRQEAELEEERARKAEEQRAKDEERMRQLAETEGARGAYRRDVLAALPRLIGQALDPESDFRYDGVDSRDVLLRHCTPLLPVWLDPEDEDIWVLNIQVAPLLGKRGLELLLPRDHELGFDRTFCKEWWTQEAGPNRLRALLAIDQLALQSTLDYAADDDHHTDPDDVTVFHAEIRHMTNRMKAIEEIKHKLLDSAIPLECVCVREVMESLDPLFSESAIEVQGFPHAVPTRRKIHSFSSATSSSFFDCVGDHWQQCHARRAFIHGAEADVNSVCGTTQVMTVHEK
ncbi:hypothetical protein LTR53_010315 [Teratosphaeriaceae sp. CCFEE 6253]|nr:hypothetical protein LTR53_010315 [Teratosphaeriaceae sp. CCFEE 6253]